MNIWCWVGIGVVTLIVLVWITKGKIFGILDDILDVFT